VTNQAKWFTGCLAVIVLGLAALGYLGLRDRGPGNAAAGDLSTPVAPPLGAAASVSPGASAGATTAPVTGAAATAAAKAAQAAQAAAKAKAASRGRPAIVRPVLSTKKGAAIWKEDGITKAMSDSGVSWFYNWAADPEGVSAPPGVGFVPMIWGASSVTASTLATAKKNGTVLLGFQEPDLADQANMSVNQALDLWPKLEATNMRLGSPGVASGADRSGQWLDRFMTGARQRGYRVDFITLHWFGSDFRTANAVSQLQSYIKATYARYHKPIWVTQYALWNFSGSPAFPSAANQADFVTKSTAMLQKLSYVERYAWFGLATFSDGSDGTGLYRPGGVPTASGKAYKAAG
jgi:Glycosyl hydrolase catalytic core